jgi:mannose-6-phosphate isomerase-like protein (cupin superfamily)
MGEAGGRNLDSLADLGGPVGHLIVPSEDRAPPGPDYRELFRNARLSVGVYSIPAEGIDRQSPHTEDEIYYVAAGEGILRIGETDHPATVGTVLFVPAAVRHRFHSVRQPLVLLVLFAPPEGSLAARH